MSFNVKATYRSETRKVTFEHSTFPSYSELVDKLRRVFSIGHSFYISKLLIFWESSPGIISLGREIRTPSQYEECIAPYTTRLQHHPGLRLTVSDDKPRNSHYAITSNPALTPAERQGIDPQPAFKCAAVDPAHIPPPPIIFPRRNKAQDSTNAVAMHPMSLANLVHPSSKSAHWEQPQLGSQFKSQPTGPGTEVKAELDKLVATFKQDLDRILSSTLQLPPAASSVNHPLSNSRHGTDPAPLAPSQPCIVPSAPLASVFSCQMNCAICSGHPEGRRYKCNACPYTLCTFCFLPDLSTVHQREFGFSHYIKVLEVTSAFDTASKAPVLNCRPTPQSETNDATVVHHNAICDVCQEIIIGVRHKCLDCPDYDLCASCLEQGSASEHNSFHSFFEIKEPGRIIVHTVFEGEQNATGSAGSSTVNASSQSMTSTQPPVTHPAVCDMCDSYIIGDRYKCLKCPDYDTCASCFRITNEQHPNHTFARITKPDDLIRSVLRELRPVHNAICDSCDKTITGCRYKCFHPDCPDFDLCENCEALPIPVHPPLHPFLKLKSADAVIPAVNRIESSGTHSSPLGVPRRCGTAFRARPRKSLQKEYESYGSPSALTNPQATPGRSSSPLYMDRFSPDLSSSCQSPTRSLTPTGVPTSPTVPIVARAANVPQEASRVTSTIGDEEPEAGDFLVRSVHAAPENNFAMASPHPQVAHLVPDLAALLRLMGQEITQVSTPESRPCETNRHLSAVVESAQTNNAVMESSLTNITLLDAPVASQVPDKPASYERLSLQPYPSLQTLIDSYGKSAPLSPPPSSPTVASVESRSNEVDCVAVEGSNSLSAVSVGNHPIEQVFPPGAEFIRSWQLLNDGTRSWPEETELVFVTGKRLFVREHDCGKIHVGAVAPNAKIEIWTSELKAPEEPGRYVSFWTLSDGHGTFFGQCVRTEIVVAESIHHSESSSLASSSIVMPIIVPDVARVDEPSSSVNVSPVTAASRISTDDGVSELGSDTSSVSILSVPSTDDEGDDAAWDESRSHVVAMESERVRAATQYVMIYDDSSEEE